MAVVEQHGTAPGQEGGLPETGRSVRVLVQGRWDDWRTTSVPLGDLEDLHWFQAPHAPRPQLHAFVWCSNGALGIPHACTGGSPGHRVRVCLLKAHIPPRLYADMAAQAGDPSQPPSSPSAAPLHGL